MLHCVPKTHCRQQHCHEIDVVLTEFATQGQSRGSLLPLTRLSKLHLHHKAPLTLCHQGKLLCLDTATASASIRTHTWTPGPCQARTPCCPGEAAASTSSSTHAWIAGLRQAPCLDQAQAPVSRSSTHARTVVLCQDQQAAATAQEDQHHQTLPSLAWIACIQTHQLLTCQQHHIKLRPWQIGQQGEVRHRLMLPAAATVVQACCRALICLTLCQATAWRLPPQQGFRVHFLLAKIT